MPVKNDSGRPRSLSRSGSIFGAIKSLVPAKLPWFGQSGEQTNIAGKRRGDDESYEVEGGQRSNKRQRVGSPVREIARPPSDARRQQLLPQPTAPATGYLEPPDNFFGSANIASGQRQPGPARATSLVPPPRNPPSRSGSRAFSPGTTSYNRLFARTQSMDPPNRYRPTFGAAPKLATLSRDVSMDDGSFRKDASSSPTRQPFRMRTSLTPQPAGQVFGPEPLRRGRNESEPPPLAQLIDRPMFVKAPSEAAQPKPAAAQAPTTLGALAEAQRTGKGIQRSHSSLQLGSDSSMQDVSATPAPAPTRPINTTEKILRELEVYKTPLLPTRLRGSATIPDMFKPKRGHAPVLMHDRESKPRLGTADKMSASEKANEEGQGVKPYAGRGGMKKLLARRRMEEDEEKERDRSTAIETDEEEASSTAQKAQALDEKLVKELAHPAEPEPQPFRPFVGGREQSSLRVGRQRTSRNHIARPQAKARGGRFSALYEEEEEDAMDDGSRGKDDAAKKLPSFQPPPGFSFAKDTTPLKLDSTNAKEPPISALPFSLTKSTTSSPAPSAQPEQGNDREPPLPITVASESQTVCAPAPLTPLLNAVPQIALIPPSPGSSVLATAPQQPASEQLNASLTGKGSSAVPNFFANSAALAKPTAQVNLPSAFSFGIPPAAPSSAPSKETPSLFGNGAGKAAAPAQSLFGADANDGQAQADASKAAPAPLFPAFGSTPSGSLFPKTPATAPSTSPEPVSAPKAAEAPSTAAPFSFGKPEEKAAPPAPVSAFSFGGPKPAEKESTPTSAFSFGAPKPAEKESTPTSGFSFGAPKPAEKDTASPSGFSFPPSKPADAPSTAPSSLPFSFGAPAKPAETTTTTTTTTTESKPSTGDSLKPPFQFGSSSTSTANPFGGASATPSPSAAEPPKSPFTFGQPTAPAPAPAASDPAPTVQAPKPLFGGASGFSFGQPAASSASSAPEPPKSPFTFGTPAPSTPAPQAKAFAFGAPSTPAGTSGSVLFGAAATSTPAASRNVTPPKQENSEIMMDESPARNASMEMNGKPELPKLNGGFGLSSAAPASPFGQPAQSTSTPFSFGSAAGTSSLFGAKTEAPAAEKPAAPFSFGGQPSTGFSFGQPKPQESAPAPVTTGFSFGQKAPEASTAPSTSGFSFNSPATPSAPSPVFAFGAPPPIAQSTSFGQPASAASSAAPSPNPFSQPAQPSGFNFSAAATPTTATATSNPFAFGSQPASPAAPSAGLPGQNGTTGFNFGAPSSAPASSPSPFAAPAALPPAGGAVFTMGAAPPPTTPGGGPRVMKKLPTRRGGKR